MSLVFPPAGARVVPGAEIEIVSGRNPEGGFRSVLFDFDGTLSVIREGWQQVMVPMMVEVLEATGTDEPRQELSSIVTEFVDRLTGKDTVYQMIQLALEVEKRGAKPLDPLEYKQIYLDRLWERIEERVEGLKSGAIRPEEMLVEGSVELLEGLKARGVDMYLASGTDHCYVVDEAHSLGLEKYFGDSIFGALDHSKEHTKAKVIQRIIWERNVAGETLLAFGDGFVEIENCREVGGYAVGVASDEVNRMGLNDWKRRRLISAGADLIITDYRCHEALVEYLFGS